MTSYNPVITKPSQNIKSAYNMGIIFLVPAKTAANTLDTGIFQVFINNPL
jgi:hypothetical protein